MYLELVTTRLYGMGYVYQLSLVSPPQHLKYFGASRQYHRSSCLLSELGRVTWFILVTVKMYADCQASFSHLIFHIMRTTKQMDLVMLLLCTYRQRHQCWEIILDVCSQIMSRVFVYAFEGMSFCLAIVIIKTISMENFLQ